MFTKEKRKEKVIYFKDITLSDGTKLVKSRVYSYEKKFLGLVVVRSEDQEFNAELVDNGGSKRIGLI